MKKKILLILIFISIFNYSNASTIDIEQLLKNYEDSCMHCKHQEKLNNIKKILSEKEFYEFNYKNENEKYKFFIPKGTIVKENKNTYIKNETFYLDFADEQNLSFPIELIKKGESFELDTYNLELILDLDNVKDSKDKVLEFRKRLLDRNKNFIKKKEDIEFEKKFEERNGEDKMKIRKIMLLTMIGLFSVFGFSCSKTGNEKQSLTISKEVKNGKKAEYKKITSDEAKKMIETQKVIVVDVRTLKEYTEGHIPNAISVPLETIENKAEAKLKNKDDLILVYCRSGRRSREAALKLIEKGYTNVIDFGGIKDWNGEVVK